MIWVLVLLLAVWAALVMIGAIVEGLLWLMVVGIVLFLATVAYGVIKHRFGRSRL